MFHHVVGPFAKGSGSDSGYGPTHHSHWERTPTVKDYRRMDHWSTCPAEANSFSDAPFDVVVWARYEDIGDTPQGVTTTPAIALFGTQMSDKWQNRGLSPPSLHCAARTADYTNWTWVNPGVIVVGGEFGGRLEFSVVTGNGEVATHVVEVPLRRYKFIYFGLYHRRQFPQAVEVNMHYVDAEGNATLLARKTAEIRQVNYGETMVTAMAFAEGHPLPAVGEIPALHATCFGWDYSLLMGDMTSYALLDGNGQQIGGITVMKSCPMRHTVRENTIIPVFFLVEGQSISSIRQTTDCTYHQDMGPLYANLGFANPSGGSECSQWPLCQVG